jgi:hypothetical protein
MERSQLEAELAQSEAAVSAGMEHVRKQREISAKLERDGHEVAAAQARALLVTFEESLRLHVDDRDRLRRELRDWTGA